MQSFRNMQRVCVRAIGEYERAEIPPTLGTIVRLRRADEGAWIKLDERPEGVHFPFPEDDSRSNDVLAYPEDCDPIAGRIPLAMVRP